MKRVFKLAGFLALISGAMAACGSDDDGSGGTGSTGGTGNRPEETGSMCEIDSDCFPNIADGDAGLRGEALCLTRVRDGYCTHTCETDSDCCAVTGECRTDFPQVCSPFEATNLMMCFFICEDEDVAGDPDADNEQAFCQRNASPDFICRSSGGGNLNRKICVPGDCGVGADCNDDTDCTDLECITSVAG